MNLVYPCRTKTRAAFLARISAIFKICETGRVLCFHIVKTPHFLNELIWTGPAVCLQSPPMRRRAAVILPLLIAAIVLLGIDLAKRIHVQTVGTTMPLVASAVRPASPPAKQTSV